MYHVLVTGAGKIGSLIACLLADSGDYQVTLADQKFDNIDTQKVLQRYSQVSAEQIDVSNKKALAEVVKQKKCAAVISSLPYFLNEHVAEVARELGIHYFDLTEDTKTTDAVKQLAEGAKSAFVPQCGLAPGFISIAANSLMKMFDKVEDVKLRVGALPQHSNNALQYALTWSTEGVINEYGNACYGIRNGNPATLRPLQGLEAIQIDGLSYEAFNTSGGLGALAEIHHGQVRNMDYKTIRYPGHCEKMRVLMEDLKLNEDRDTLKRILENAIPKTYQDVVLVYVSVTGYKQDNYLEQNYVNKVYPRTIADQHWSAIQITTASGICGVVDMVLGNANEFQGLVLQEEFKLESFLANRFGKYYQQGRI